MRSLSWNMNQAGVSFKFWNENFERRGRNTHIRLQSIYHLCETHARRYHLSRKVTDLWVSRYVYLMYILIYRGRQCLRYCKRRPLTTTFCIKYSTKPTYAVAPAMDISAISWVPDLGENLLSWPLSEKKWRQKQGTFFERRIPCLHNYYANKG